MKTRVATPAADANSSADQSIAKPRGPVRTVADLPGPKPLPLLGNAHQIDSAQFHLQLENWSKQYGAAYKIHLGSKQIVVLSDVNVIGGLLRDRPDAFRRASRTIRILAEVGTAGLFTAEGEEWRKQRKLVMRALTPEVIRNFFPTMSMMTERLLVRWHDALAAGRTVDILRDLKAYTLDVTIGLAMGQDINTLEHDNNPLQRDIEQLFHRVGRRVTSPIAYWRYFKLPVDRAAEASSKRIGETVREFVEQARKRLAEHPECRQKPGNMLEALVVARDETGSEFTDAHVIGNAVTMVFAGEDTTSNTIAWMLDFIARDPRAAACLAREADEVLGADKVLADYASLDRFRYTEAATDEAMRLKPVASLVTFESNRELMVGDLQVASNTVLIGLLRPAGQNEAAFPQAEIFRPERWLAGEATPANDNPGRKLFPFGGGPRFCPGRFLAMAEIKMVVSMLVRNFELSIDPAAPPVKELYTFTITPSALPVILKARSAIK
ncbi:cytochrome P450 [soil metagenome]